MAQPYENWDFQNSHVDPNALTQPGGARGNYISSESIMLAAGPSTMKLALDGTLQHVVPIGVCDTIQVMQNKGVITLYEIGSRIPYIIPGRPITQFQISRVMFNGDSLLSAITKGIVSNGEANPDDYESSSMGTPGESFSPTNAPADSTFFLNLASHFFNAPFGLAMFFKDSEKDWIAAYYAENCVIQQHSMALQGQNMIVMENASIRCTTFLPMTGPGTASSSVTKRTS